MNSGYYSDGTQGFDRTKAVDPMIGKVLDGRYAILTLLGSGGMGAVYQANQVGLDKPVAVKIMHPQLMMDDRTVQRFKHEVKAMSSLQHPGLISIIDAGTTDYGTPYFVMEFLPSRPLSDIIQEEVFLPGDRVKRIVAQIADALSHAHSKNIIHRDLKPANILVIEGVKDHVKIVDLGVAKLIGGDDAGALQKLTQTGEVFGSPLYMAPEQVLGKPHDGRTDIYQLGCVVFEMVTGVPPLVKPSAIMTMNSHVTEPAPTFNQIMPELPMDDDLRQLETIVLKCLEKNPADRYQSMQQVLQAVELSPAAMMSETRPPTGQPSTYTPVKIKDRFTTAQNQAVEEPQAPVEPQPSKEKSIRVSNVSVARSREHAAKKAGFGGLQRNQQVLIIGGSITVLFVCIVALVIGIYSILSSQHANGVMGNPAVAADLVTFEYPANSSDKVDLRVLSVYQGTPERDVAPGTVRRGAVEVEVNDTGKPLVLVLNAYMPTVWTINKSSDKVRIHNVITVGYHYQTVKGVPPLLVHPQVYYEFGNKDGTISKYKTHGNAFEEFFFTEYAKTGIDADPSFIVMKARLEKLTKSHLHNFQGVYSTGKFTVQ